MTPLIALALQLRPRLLLALFGLLPIAPRPALSWNLFSREDPRVRAANQAYGAGKYDDALRGYEDSLRDHPNAPELQFDRGNALFKLGRQAEAREAYLSALGARDSQLKAQDYYNMGNALWNLEKNDEAAQAYERALTLDPSFEEARHNLELLLAPPPDAGQPDGGGSDGGSDGGSNDGGRADGHGDGGSPPDAGADGGRPPPAPDGGSSQPSPKPEGPDGGAPPPPPANTADAGPAPKPQPLDKMQADQLLDALRQREKNLQLWKFRQKNPNPRETEKDW